MISQYLTLTIQILQWAEKLENVAQNCNTATWRWRHIHQLHCMVNCEK